MDFILQILVISLSLISVSLGGKMAKVTEVEKISVPLSVVGKAGGDSISLHSEQSKVSGVD